MPSLERLRRRTGGAAESFGYNGRGSRVAENSSFGNLSLFRSGTGAGAKLLGDGLASFTPGVGEKRSSATTNWFGDGASHTAQIDASQQVTARRSYDAFGNITASSGTWNGPFGAGARVGGETLGGSGLVGIGGDAFDTDSGRFLVRRSAGRGAYTWFQMGRRNIDPDIRRRLELWPDRSEAKRLKERYIRDPAFKERIHRGLSDRKTSGPDGRHNDDSQTTDADIDEAIREADEKKEEEWRHNRGRQQAMALPRPRIAVTDSSLPAFDPGPFILVPPMREVDGWQVFRDVVIITGCVIIVVATKGAGAPVVVNVGRHSFMRLGGGVLVGA